MKKTILLSLSSLVLGAFAFMSTTYAAGSGDFVTTWDTTKQGSPSTGLIIPLLGGPYNIDCNNDGVYELTGKSNSVTCSYATGGIKTVRVSGANMRIFFNNAGDRQKILSIDQWGTGLWSDMTNAFYGCININSSAIDMPLLTGSVSFKQMFLGASSFNGKIGHWDTSRVVDMQFLFSQASSFNQPIGGWNTSNVINMYAMFDRASSFNQPIGGWNTSKVNNMSYMFNQTYQFNQPINTWTGSDGKVHWDVSKVTDMSYMFRLAIGFNQPIGDWDTSKVTTMYYMFASNDGTKLMAFNQDISKWNTSNVITMRTMFQLNTAFNQPINTWTGSDGKVHWDVSKVTDMSYMFRLAIGFNQPIGDWDTSKVTTMYYMFASNDGTKLMAFNQDISKWNTSNVITMRTMFQLNTAFNQPINTWTGSDGKVHWDVSKVTDMSYMFLYASSFNQPIGGWNTSAVTTMANMFAGAASFDQNIGSLPIIGVTTMAGMFNGAKLSINNYNALLTGWASQLVKLSVPFDGGYSTYCGIDATVARNDVLSGTKLWTITDGGSNCIPTIVLSGDSVMQIGLGDTYIDQGAVWTDDKNASGEYITTTGLIMPTSGSVDTNTLGTYVLTYEYIDDAGYTATITRTVTVVDKTTPVIIVSGNSTMTLTQGDVYTESGASWIDNVDGSGNIFTGTYGETGSFQISGTVNITIPGTYIIQYTKVDSNGNIGSATRTVIIQPKPTTGFAGGGGGGVIGGNTSPTDTPTSPTQPIQTGKIILPLLPTLPTSSDNELIDAYNWSYKLGLTTQPTLEEARFYDSLSRGELAKILSEYAINVLGKKPIVGKAGCDAYTDFNQTSKELAGYMKTVCELEIMGLKSDVKTPLEAFRPRDRVPRAELVTTISRMIYGNKYDNYQDYGWWTDHMDKLASDGIIKITNPNLIELRGNVYLMLFRLQ